MAFGIIGKKVGMTQYFTPDGTRQPVTVVEAGPCVVLQKKTAETDGYAALQLGFESRPVQWKSKVQSKMGGKMKGTRKRNSVTRPMWGHFKAAGKGSFRILREFRLDNPDNYEVGQEITVTDFAIGEIVNITGTSKGKGFQGVIKRHGFHGGPGSHGATAHRVPGSIGMCAWPARTLKNTKLPGHTGAQRVTVKNLLVQLVDVENNLLYVSGAIPGPTSGVVYIQKAGK